ncbi:tetracycline resistance protein [Paenibacillus pini JCM 16418]|uniref:Tetracycline resistance protein n=1 Tax=Paenibacillus pini JCM 16418 TaxID=1236976 RepID=W7YL43_9BACL|nr:tetracycline resistance protein [Paenibacillus pini JCM 16418]
MMNDRAAKVFIGMRFIIALASSTMFTTYGIYYVTMLDLNPFQLVLVGTVLELTVLLFEGITGVVADTYGRRTSVIIAMFILGLGFVLEGSVIWLADLSSSVPSFAWLLISQVMFGIGWTFVSGADTAGL